MILLLSVIFLIFALLILILKPNLIFILFALELILLGVNINMIFASIILDDFLGQYLTLILFSVAALDTCLGLIIIFNYYHYHLINTSLITKKSNTISFYRIPIKAYSTSFKGPRDPISDAISKSISDAISKSISDAISKSIYDEIDKAIEDEIDKGRFDEIDEPDKDSK
jgi:NADH-quinone oxidoreductase subunit K